MKKQLKLYNVIFPIWILLFIPPVIILSLLGNFIIDSIVIILVFYILKIENKTKYTKGTLYKKSILKIWGFGFLADFIGAVILFFIFGMDLLPIEISYSAVVNPFKDIWGFILSFFGILVAASGIYIFNYYITFKQTIPDQKLRMKIALSLAIITMPWTYLIPVDWMYS